MLALPRRVSFFYHFLWPIFQSSLLMLQITIFHDIDHLWAASMYCIYTVDLTFIWCWFSFRLGVISPPYYVFFLTMLTMFAISIFIFFSCKSLINFNPNQTSMHSHWTGSNQSGSIWDILHYVLTYSRFDFISGGSCQQRDEFFRIKSMLILHNW
jgi:hypothetical protein